MNSLCTGYYSVIQYCPDRSRMEATKQQLVVLACFSEAALEHQNRIADLMAEHDVQFFTENEVDRLANLILTTAH